MVRTAPAALLLAVDPPRIVPPDATLPIVPVPSINAPLAALMVVIGIEPAPPRIWRLPLVITTLGTVVPVPENRNVSGPGRSTAPVPITALLKVGVPVPYGFTMVRVCAPTLTTFWNIGSGPTEASAASVTVPNRSIGEGPVSKALPPLQPQFPLMMKLLGTV